MTIYGQEKDNATWALSRMNMILHGDATADIAKGDTITSPKFVAGNKLKTFDFVVANPPFSQKSWSNGLEEDYGRFEYGMPPPKNGDYAFLLHALKSLKSNGKGVVVMPHGVLFRGNAEAGIRRELLKRGFIKGIIGLPANLFYGTGIAACLVALDKEGATDKRPVFVIDASKGFIKDGAKNRLRSQDVHKIVDVFDKQSEVERYSRLVPYAEIEANDFNLNISRYIDSSEPEDIQDLDAHLHGGIPNRDIDALQPFWDAFPSLRDQLFTENRAGYSELAVPVSAVHQTILDSTEFLEFVGNVQLRVADWFAAHRGALAGIDETIKPNDLITVLGDDLLARFHDVPLLDAYDVYEQLLSYWHETMHDDVFLVMKDGWVGASKPRQPIVDKERKLTEVPDLTIGSGKNAKKYKMDLLPPAIVTESYFGRQVSALQALETAVASASTAVEEYTEEHAIEDGLVWEAVEDDKITKTLAAARLREAKHEGAEDDEIAALQHVISLFEAESAAKKTVKEEKAALDIATLEQYRKLGADDIRRLVLDAKWHSTVATRAKEVTTALVEELLARIQELGTRYANTVEQLNAELNAIAAEVDTHLAEIGFSS
jgi:type I restriction enzyme M protein